MYQSLARAYALTVQCAAACAPFKSSPATYATCCKQHAATARAPQAPVRPAGFRTATVKPVVIKSKLPKSVPAVKLIDDVGKSVNLDSLRNYYKSGGSEPTCPGGQVADITGKCPPLSSTTNSTSPPTSSGGGGGDSDCTKCNNGANFCNIERHTGCGRGCGSDGKSGRLQWGVTNSGPTSDMRATIRIPNNFRVPDTLTLQLGGSQHSGSCKSVQGYKAYIGIKGGKNGVGIETGSCKHKVYPDDFPNSNKAPLFTLQPGHTYNLRGTKENLTNGVRVSAYAQEGNGPVTLVAQAIDTGQLRNTNPGDPETPFFKRMGDAGPIDQIRIDNWDVSASEACPYLIKMSVT